MSIQNRLWILMGKKLSGSITGNEEEELEALFQKYPDVWYTYEVLNSLEDKDNIPEEFINEIETLLKQSDSASPETDKTIPLKPTRHVWFKVSVAAVVLISFSLSLIIGYRYLKTPVKSVSNNNEIIVLNGTKTDVTLPDGSRIILNSGSKLTYPKNYALSDVREVWLTGEAYFNIQHDEKHPFIIHTESFNIKDIGTTFNVKAYPGENTVASLIEGAIEVSFKNNTGKKVLLKPHQKIVLASNPIITNDKISLQPAVENTKYKIMPLEVDEKNKAEFLETAWVDNQLVFKNEPFEDVAKKMERRYNVTISFGDEKVKASRLTGYFKIENVDQALKELTDISPFKYQIDHDKIFIQSLDN